ncbi:hypothetical protein PRIPAC_72308 [Pristionchus pacificus]|uniref:ShK domain-containing protein n=1 Tax=Pristionchus pacificus TaxID=54126 RepID=A0A2A6CRN8_PRIPA|nr:hypothetical protein PRIPAC_72308 [Pristionchus pacificus]|eukprot:PDM80691.1 ShK domain-containing protein [Pristionchus pacificus]
MFLFCFSLFLTIYAQFEWISEDNCDRSQVCDIAILVCPYGYTCSSMDEIDGIGFCCRDRRVLPPPPIDQCNDLSIPGGISECQAKSWLCRVPIYDEVMRVQCRKTCGYCNGDNRISQPGRPFTVIDDMFPFTRGGSRQDDNCYDKTIRGRQSDCPARAHLCQSESHIGIMHRECPKTCKVC